MKYCAYYLQNNKRVKVTISQILFGEVSVKGKILYSYTAGNPRVFFVGPGVNRRAHFRFENGYQGEEGGGESVTHSTYKDVIASVDQLALCFFRGKEKERVVLHGVHSQTEYRINANGKPYIADICVDFEYSEPAYFAKSCHNRVLIEVTHKHPTDKQKYTDLNMDGYVVFEYVVNKGFELNNNHKRTQTLCGLLEGFANDELHVRRH